MNKFADTNYFRRPEDFRLISSTDSKYTRVDAYEKVTGKAKYAGDFMAPNMLVAKVKHSPIPRGRIVKIDTSKAEALPGVKGILTGKDFPVRITEDIEILCQKEVRMVGDPVVAVCAVSEEIAEQAVDLIEVEYEKMKPVFDVYEAMADGAPDVQGFGYDNHNFGPCCHQVGTNDGKDIEEEFAKAAYVSHTDFKTHRIQHAPIEPHATYAEYDSEKDEWTVHQSTTMSFGDQFWLAHGFQKDVSHFHIIRPYVGGAFGSKSNWPYSEFIACAFARMTLRPVRFVQTREEEFETMHGRHPFYIHIDTAFDKDGRILAKKADQVLDGGAYGVSHSQFAAVNLSALWCAFPYSTISLHIVAMLKKMGLNPIAVVTGYRAEELESHLFSAGVRFVKNERFREMQMFDSVRMGILAVKEDCERILIMPMDIPAILPETFRQVLNIDAPIVRTSYEGQACPLRRSAQGCLSASW